MEYMQFTKSDHLNSMALSVANTLTPYTPCKVPQYQAKTICLKQTRA